MSVKNLLVHYLLPIIGAYLFNGAVMAQELILTDDISDISATPYLSMLEDTSKQLTIQEVIAADEAGRFKINTQDYIHLGRDDSVWWNKLTLQLQTDQRWHIQFGTPDHPDLYVYLVPKGSSDIIPLGSMRKDFEYQHLPRLKLPDKPEHYSLYLRTGKNGHGPLYIPFRLISADTLITETAHTYLLFGSILSGLIVLALYNLFLFISLKNLSYLTLAAFLISIALVIQRTINIVPFLSMLSNPDTFYYHMSFQFAIASSIQFWRQSVNTWNLFPNADKIIRNMLVLTLLIAPFQNLLPKSDLWSYFSALIFIPFITVLGVMALHKGSKIMKSLSLAFFVFLGSVIPIVLWGANIGIITKIDTPLLIFSTGSLLTGILLSFTLAEHNRQLRLQAERAQTESEAKDNFLTTMSHELRTPMHAVTSVVDLMKSTDLSAKQSSYLEKLKISSDHMLKLINQILDLTRINNDESPSNNNPFNLTTLLHELNELLTDVAKEKQLTFSLNNQMNVSGKELIGDATHLKQILVNLLYNAIKFTEEGSITLTIKQLPGTNENTVTLNFIIEDTGIGIPLEKQPSIFHAFTQVDNSRARKYGGSGLGLAISHRLVKQMGGTLDFKSMPAKGSEFFFTLEFQLSTEKQALLPTPEKTVPLQPSLNKTRIMLVDDVPLNRYLGTELLQIIGTQAIAAESGVDALDKLKQSPVDVVLMDISMPDMDGYEATRRIRAYPQFKELPILALTAHATEDERERCLTAGMNDYLPKPFELHQLQEMIERWS